MKNMMLSVLLMAVCLRSSASVLLLDFGNTASAPTLGGTWNTDIEADVAAGGLNYADGSVATGVGLLGEFSVSTNDQGTWGADKDWVVGDAVADYMWSGAALSITLTGLDDAQRYDISWVAARNGGTNRLGSYTVQGLTTTDEVSSTGINAATSFTNRTILNWSAVAPVSGEIVLSANPNSGHTVFVNALRIVAIPEPSTLTLLGIAGMLMAASRLRRK